MRRIDRTHGELLRPRRRRAADRCRRDEMDAAIFTVAIQAGPRKSEIRALRVKDCDFAPSKLRFARGYTNEQGFAANKRKELRSVPMTADIAARLRPFCEGKEPEALVFEPERGAQAICGLALYRRFLAAAERAGLRSTTCATPSAPRRSRAPTCTRSSGDSATSRSGRPRSTCTTAATPTTPTRSRRLGRPPPRPTWCRCAEQPDE